MKLPKQVSSVVRMTSGAPVGYVARTAARAASCAQGVLPAIRGRGCMAWCLDQAGDDPFAYENCHCICYGHPGRTCFLQ